MKKKKVILGVLALTMILTGLSGCKETSNQAGISGENMILGENEQIEGKETYNNGGSFVSYKGKTYYREYNNASIEKVALSGDFYYETEKKISKYINVILENGRIENLFKDGGYGDFYISNDRFFFRGYQNKLYSVNMQGEDYREIGKGYYLRYDEENQEIYYINTQNNNSTYKINTQNLKITKVTDEIVDIPESGEMTIDVNITSNESGEYVYIDAMNDTNKIILSKDEVEEFKNKYAANEPEDELLVQIREVEKVNDKIYFLLEVAKHKADEDIGSRYAYERIASEAYGYDLNTGKKTLIYLYKVTDKVVVESGDSLSGDEVEPLGENEMYLKIRLKDKGLQDTFEVRVEEVGGLIIGKRIEYEGTHSRAEEMLTIKVTREVGAMLNVYIDDKLDSQMLIEAE